MKKYHQLSIGQRVRVQVYYGELTNQFFIGTITNMDGQNIVVCVESRENPQGKLREYEACNPDFAVVTEPIQ